MISIIIPLYNVEKFIERCLRSIERQDYRSFEVIVVDDGSKDASVEKVKAFMAESSLDVTLIEQENRGVSAARNAGIRRAEGEYLCFVDSDDALDPAYLSVMLDAMNEHQADLCACGHRTIGEDDDELCRFSGDPSAAVLTAQEALEILLYKKNSIGIWCLLIRRETLGDLRFTEGCRFSEDLEMVWKLVAVSSRTVIVDAPLYCYRRRSQSAMTVIDERRLDGLKAMQGLEGFIRDKAPEFSPRFEQYGVARWVWSTLWQIAHGSRTYRDFRRAAEVYQPKKYMKRLLSFKNRPIAFLAFLYVYAPPLYYAAVKVAKRRYRKIGG